MEYEMEGIRHVRDVLWVYGSSNPSDWKRKRERKNGTRRERESMDQNCVGVHLSIVVHNMTSDRSSSVVRADDIQFSTSLASQHTHTHTYTHKWAWLYRVEDRNRRKERSMSSVRLATIWRLHRSVPFSPLSFSLLVFVNWILWTFFSSLFTSRWCK